MVLKTQKTMLINIKSQSPVLTGIFDVECVVENAYYFEANGKSAVAIWHKNENTGSVSFAPKNINPNKMPKVFTITEFKVKGDN